MDITSATNRQQLYRTASGFFYLPHSKRSSYWHSECAGKATTRRRAHDVDDSNLLRKQMVAFGDELRQALEQMANAKPIEQDEDRMASLGKRVEILIREYIAAIKRYRESFFQGGATKGKER